VPPLYLQHRKEQFDMFETLRKRLHREEKGFTLIELLVVIIILGILVAIAVPSYLSFAGRAKDSAAMADVRAIVPSIEAYYSDLGDYSAMSLTALKTSYDQSIDDGATTPYALSGLGASTYCVQATVGGQSAFKNGPAAKVLAGSCP
jgi:type IV pilus assembly protein PilA